MIDGLKTYPVIKDSGVPGLDGVPEHWEASPNRACASCQPVPKLGPLQPEFPPDADVMIRTA